VLPTVDPAGTIATSTAGLIEFSATLSWDRLEDVPEAPTLPTLPETARSSVVETDDPARCRREILGEILALSERDLGSALETVLRSLTTTAALSEAVLETRAARVTLPRPAPAATLQALALDLWEAGFRVGFAPSWTPVPVGVVGLGVLGAEQELNGFLLAHPSWRVA
jgi:hypothetical protein